MPRHQASAASISRRGLLVAGALVAATGAGAAAGLLRPAPRQDVALAAPPPELARALDREQQLIAGLDAALRRDASLAARLAQVRADHAAHAEALHSALAAYPAAAATAAPRSASSASSPGPSPPSLTQLRASEANAAGGAARDSLNLDGAAAALLASISAAEAGHAELLA